MMYESAHSRVSHLDDAVERHVVVVIARSQFGKVLACHWSVEPVQLNHNVPLYADVSMLCWLCLIVKSQHVRYRFVQAKREAF